MPRGVTGPSEPHEHDPRRVYSTTSTDWQARVDFDRLRRDRLARARMKMEEHDLGAIVCFVTAPDQRRQGVATALLGATMLLGDDCKVVNDPDKEERLALSKLRKNSG